MKFHKIFTLSAVTFLLFASKVSAQKDFEYRSSPVMTTPRAATINIEAVREDFSPVLKTIEQPKPGGENYSTYLEKIKSQIPEATKDLSQPLKKNGGPAMPVKLRSFEGNRYPTGMPNDNDMAISNNGIVVSVVNSNISMFDSTGTLLKSISLAAFSDTLKLKQSKYDPRVLYDPQADRFIIAFLSGKDDSTSFTILAFSKSNDPIKDWNIYTVPGNPLNDTTWSDYPIIAINKDELFLTLNALENNKSWQEGFVQSYIWQIDKASGYSGANLKMRLHSGFQASGYPIRNLCPVQGGSGLTDKDCYFLSNRNFSPFNDTIFMITLKGKLDQSISLNFKVLRSDKPYGVPPSAKQAVKRKLQTNDARVLDAVIENGKIHFVGNSRHQATNMAGVFHGVISGLTGIAPTVTLNILSDTLLEYGYPAIAYAGKSAQEDDMIILVNHSAETVFAGNSAFYYKNGEYSEILTLKSGTSTILITGANERWGDYSGAQLRYNQPGKVWVAATFGHPVKDGFMTQLAPGTWISEIQAGPEISSVKEAPAKVVADAKTYPSPLFNYEPLQVEFSLEKPEYISFIVYDMSGREVRQIMRERAKPGKNLFSFNINALKPGQYILRITDTENNAVIAKKFVVQ